MYNYWQSGITDNSVVRIPNNWLVVSIVCIQVKQLCSFLCPAVILCISECLMVISVCTIAQLYKVNCPVDAFEGQVEVMCERKLTNCITIATLKLWCVAFLLSKSWLAYNCLYTILKGFTILIEHFINTGRGWLWITPYPSTWNPVPYCHHPRVLLALFPVRSAISGPQ